MTITVEYGEGFARLTGVHNPVTVEGPILKECLIKALQRIRNTEAKIKFKAV